MTRWRCGIQSMTEWNEIKEGKYKGFSVEGMFAKEEAIPTDEQIIDAAIDAING